MKVKPTRGRRRIQMLQDLANDGGFVALKRADEDREGWRHRERMSKTCCTAEDYCWWVVLQVKKLEWRDMNQGPLTRETSCSTTELHHRLVNVCYVRINNVFVTIVFHSYRILFIAVGINNIATWTMPYVIASSFLLNSFSYHFIPSPCLTMRLGGTLVHPQSHILVLLPSAMPLSSHSNKNK